MGKRHNIYTKISQDYFSPLTYKEAKYNIQFTSNHGVIGVDNATTVWGAGPKIENVKNLL
jgi:hypothetical protein